MSTPAPAGQHTSTTYRAHGRLAVGCIISAAVIIALARTVNVREAWASVLTIRPFDVLLVLAIYLAGLVLKAERWRILLGAGHTVRRGSVYEALVIGFALNAVLPLHSGDVARAFLVSGERSVSRSWAALTLLIERIFDFGAITLLVALAALAVAIPDWIARPTLILAISTGALGMGLIIGRGIVLASERKPGSAIIRFATWLVHSRLSRRWNLDVDLGQISPAFHALSTTQSLLTVSVLSLTVWGANTAFLAAALAAFAVQPGLPAIILLSGALSLGLAAPSSPAGIGVYQGIVVVVLGLFGIASDQALAAGVVAHLLSFVPVTVIGLALLIRRTLYRQR